MGKPTFLVFCDHDQVGGHKFAETLRNGKNVVFVRRALRHPGEESEICEKVYILPDVNELYRVELRRLYRVIEEVQLTPPLPPEEVIVPPPQITAPKVRSRKQHKLLTSEVKNG